MEIATEAAIAELDAVIAAATPKPSFMTGVVDSMSSPDIENQATITRLAAAIQRLSLPGSAYRMQEEALARRNGHPSRRVLWLLGVLHAMRSDYAAGYARSVTELVNASVFADFLEMASELQKKNYKDAAAVIAGSVLEEHLRRLAEKSGVAIEKSPGAPKKADTLNAEIVRAGVYNQLDQKSVTAWLGLRNHAAHGRYDEYDQRQVDAFIRDVRDFMVRHPA